jgi:hypothetical protein
MSVVNRNIKHKLITLAILAASAVAALGVSPMQANADTWWVPGAPGAPPVKMCFVYYPGGQGASYSAYVPCSKVPQVPAGPGFFHIAKCAATIAVVAAASGKVLGLVRSMGGFWEAAKVLIGAGTAQDLLGAIGGAAAAFLGYQSIRDACFN